MPRVTLDNGRITLINGDCLEILPKIKPGVIDMVFADLPYGTTQNKWDSVIPFTDLWRGLHICAKVTTPYICTATTPFHIKLGASNFDELKYDWIWEKTNPTGHLNAKIQPLREHEHILVFYGKQCTYNPQMIDPDKKRIVRRGKRINHNNYNYMRDAPETEYIGYYPVSILQFPSVAKPTHPTQKPVELLEYLIKTYSNEDDVILDPTAGSGTTPVAAIKTRRRCIAIELDTVLGYFDTMIERCEAAIAERDKRNEQ